MFKKYCFAVSIIAIITFNFNFNYSFNKIYSTHAIVNKNTSSYMEPIKSLTLCRAKNPIFKDLLRRQNVIDFLGSIYIKNPVLPKHLFVVSQDSLTSAERVMLSCLQGAVNPHSSSQIYILSSLQPDYKVWLEDLKNNHGVCCEIISDPWSLLDKYKGFVQGYILYNNESGKDSSINNACSLASLCSCIAIDESIEAKVRAHGITDKKGDCRNTDKYWGYKNLWNKGLNHNLVIELSPDRDSPLRDYAVMAKALIFYEDNVTDMKLRGEIFSSMRGHAVCLGWGPDEFNNVSIASKFGVSMVAADWSLNLTVLSAFSSLPAAQNAASNIPSDKDVHYVTFIMSDGDNLQWNLGKNFGSSKWYGSPIRGEFNLGWSLPPSLYHLAPTVFDLYYKNASRGNTNDYFVVSPSGNGYIYPSKFAKDKLDSYIYNLNCYMKDVDEKYVTIIDDNSFYKKDLWHQFTSRSNIEGLFYLDYHKHDKYHGEIIWSDNKPIVSCRDLLWEGLENEYELVKKINKRVISGQIDIHKPESYTFVYVHVWSKNMSDIKKTVDELHKNTKVRIVTPEVFMQLIQQNINKSTPAIN